MAFSLSKDFFASDKLTVNGTFSYSSDDRIKHNETLVENALETINKLKIQRYFKTDTIYDRSHQFELDNSGNPITDEKYYHEIGIIAQEIKKIPELAFCVGGNEQEEETIIHYQKDSSGNDILDENGKPIVESKEKVMKDSPLFLNYNNIFCYHIKATQELNNKVAILESENAELKAELAAIKAHLGL